MTNMKYVGLLIITVVVISGCIQQSTSPETNRESSKKLSTLEPSELILQLSDFPSNYSLRERTERVKSDISQDAINLGWKKGYYALYGKADTKLLDVLLIEHFVSVYPIENISNVLTLPKNSTEKVKYDELSKPNIGDASIAFRITQKDELGVEYRVYQIEFVKMDVYESLRMIGTTTDYDLLKNLSKKAEAKIR